MRPEDEAAESEYRAFLRVGGIDRERVHRIRLEKRDIPGINLDDYCAIITGGSPFDVSSPETKKSPAQKQIESFFNHLFDQVIAKDFPFLGACSGNGLLGRYCGTTISGKYSEPVGSVNVYMTNEGLKDPLLVDLPQQFKVLVGHKESCESIPEGAVLLVTSKPCPIQMFRIKNNIYATQFHPEADIEEFILRINIYKNHEYFAPEKAEQLKKSLKNIETPVPKKILKRFVRRYT